MTKKVGSEADRQMRLPYLAGEVIIKIRDPVARFGRGAAGKCAALSVCKKLNRTAVATPLPPPRRFRRAEDARPPRGTMPAKRGATAPTPPSRGPAARDRRAARPPIAAGPVPGR